MEWKFDMTTLSTWPHSLSQVSFVAPPKHEPVVIKLGEDLEKAGGDLFELRLEMMIKELGKKSCRGKQDTNTMECLTHCCFFLLL